MGTDETKVKKGKKGKKGKKKPKPLTEEEKWAEEIKGQEAKLFEKEHTFSKKDMKAAKKFMEKKHHHVEEEAVSLEDEKIFRPVENEVHVDNRFQNAKVIEVDDNVVEPVFQEDPKEEKYVHLNDDKNYVEKIEIDKHEFKGDGITKEELLGKKKGKKGKKKDKSKDKKKEKKKGTNK